MDVLLARSILLASVITLIAAGCNQQSPTPLPSRATVATSASAQVFSQATATSPMQAGTPPVTASPAPMTSYGPTLPIPSPTAPPAPAATPTVAPTASPTPAPTLRRLTTGGCCTQPFWAPDSRRVLFIDRPEGTAQAAIWGVDISRPDASPEIVTERIALYTAQMDYVIEPGRTATTIERIADGARWTVPARGTSVSISPGRTRIAWQVTNESVPFERQTTELWVARLDGSDARQVATLNRGGLSGWISDDVVLLSGRASLQSREQILYAFSLSSGGRTDLVRAEQLRSTSLSPGGTWLTYYIALDQDAAKNGLYVVRTDGTARRQLDRALFGSFRWRDDNRLLVIPFRPEAATQELWQVGAATGDAQRVVDPAITPFKVANGDWTVSPDGRSMAFVAAEDRNIWLLALPR